MMKELHIKESGITLATLMFHLDATLAVLQDLKHICCSMNYYQLLVKY